MDAQVAAEGVARVKYMAESGDAGESMAELPTRGDIGELFLFAHQLRMRSEEFEEMAREIEKSLPVLGEMAPNAAIRAATNISENPK